MQAAAWTPGACRTRHPPQHGEEHPATLTAFSNLAHWTGAAGNPAAARDQYAGLLPVLERILGAGHPDTLTARRNLAYWTRQAENPGKTKEGS